MGRQPTEVTSKIVCCHSGKLKLSATSTGPWLWVEDMGGRENLSA